MNSPATQTDHANEIPALSGKGRADDVRRMFEEVSPRYDILNHLLSGGMDVLWRAKTTRMAPPHVPGPVVDLCTGTGDLAFAYARANRNREVLGFDFCEPMIARAVAKAEKRAMTQRTRFAVADALNVPVRSNLASVVSVAFGIRNTESIERAVNEMTRIAAPGGTVAILEFSRPTAPIFAPLYLYYFRNVLPRIGRLISSAHTDAYDYLPKSVMAFPEPEEMASTMTAAGLTDIHRHPMTLGTVSLYVGTKKP